MARASRRGVVVGLVSVLVAGLAATAGWVVSGTARADVRGALPSALAVAPADTTLLGFTDWERLRRADVGDPGPRDLATRSALADIGQAVPRSLGWSVEDLRWEAFVQDRQAGVLVAAPDDGLSWGSIRAGLREAGFDDDGDGAWSATPDVVLATGLGDQFTEVRLVPRAGVLVAASNAEAVDAVVRSATGRDPSLSSVRRAVDTAEPLVGADTALLQAGSLGCDAAAVPDDAAAEADAAQQRAGSLEPFAYAGRALVDRGGSGPAAQTATFAMTFDEVAVAREQATVRERLATGPFIGGSGQVEDQLRDPRVEVRQATVDLSFTRSADGIVLMLGTVPLLFASC